LWLNLAFEACAFRRLGSPFGTAVETGLDRYVWQWDVLMRNDPIVVCFPFVGDELGGSHISAIKLIEALDPASARALIVLHVDDGPVASYLRQRGIPFEVLELPVLSSSSREGRRAGLAKSLPLMMRAVLPLTRFLKARAVDVLHTNDGRIHAIWALPAKLAGARQVWHHRGDPDARGVNLVAPLLASHIVTVSRFAVPRRPILPVTHKLSVLHSPFDPPGEVGDRADARAMLFETLGCAPGTRFLGTFGLLISRKRPLAFVDVVAAYVRDHPEVPLMGLLFGVPGKEEPDLDKAVLCRAQERGIGDRIRLMGYRDPPEPWMQAIDVMLVPAVREPFGRTLVEAMFLGTPVVATDDGGNPEAIEHGVNGILVPPDEPGAFVAPVHRLLTDPVHRAEIVEAARTRAHADYDVDGHVAGLMAVYEKLRRPPAGMGIRSVRRTTA
jgi:glycosyltransferase involved in cell wall biosynthesis